MGSAPVRRHAWREVVRQLRESGGAGVVAVLLVSFATTLGGVLVTGRDWVNRRLLPGTGPATVVTALQSGADAPGLVTAFKARFPGAHAVIMGPSALQQQLAAEFPELSSVLFGLGAESFPTLLEARIAPADEEAAATWLRANAAVSLVESSRHWQERLEAAVHRVVWAGAAIAGALLAGCSVLVLLVVRLLVLNHGDEIDIMRLIGAHEADIRLPYLASGTFLGVAGGLLGVAVLSALAAALRGTLAGVQPSTPLLMALPLVGGTTAAVGAMLGLASLPEEP